MYCLVPEKPLRLAPQGHFLRGVYGTFYLAPQGHFLRAPSVILLHIEPFNNYLQTIYYDKKQLKRQGYIAVKLEYRCRICRVGLNVRIIFKRFSFIIKR